MVLKVLLYIVRKLRNATCDFTKKRSREYLVKKRRRRKKAFDSFSMHAWFIQVHVFVTSINKLLCDTNTT